MDEPVPKLPAYMFSRANGSYRYKRNVPKKLVNVLGKADILRGHKISIGDRLVADLAAMRDLPGAPL